MFLRFFGFGIFAFEVGERHNQRLVSELDWMFIDATSANFRLADNPGVGSEIRSLPMMLS
jgi:hypothetical protein